MDKQISNNLSEQAYEKIKEWIINLELEPEKKLKEVELSEKLNISRTPIREAIKKLRVEGFITYTVRNGNVVTPLSVENFVEIYQVRDVLENLGVKLGALNWTDPKEIEDIKDITERQMIVAKTEEINTKEFLTIDKIFHEKLIALSKNQLLIDELKKVNELYYRYNYYSIFKTRALLTVQEHLEIVNAMELRDSKKAQRIVKNHLQIIRESILIGLAQRDTISVSNLTLEHNS